jgi:hypothetical protein
MWLTSTARKRINRRPAKSPACGAFGGNGPGLAERLGRDTRYPRRRRASFQGPRTALAPAGAPSRGRSLDQASSERPCRDFSLCFVFASYGQDALTRRAAVRDFMSCIRRCGSIPGRRGTQFAVIDGRKWPSPRPAPAPDAAAYPAGELRPPPIFIYLAIARTAAAPRCASFTLDGEAVVCGPRWSTRSTGVAPSPRRCRTPSTCSSSTVRIFGTYHSSTARGAWRGC